MMAAGNPSRLARRLLLKAASPLRCCLLSSSTPSSPSPSSSSSPAEGGKVTLTAAQVYDLASGALMQSGLEKEHASTLAKVISSAERDQCYSHGLFRLPGYCRAIQMCGPFLDPVVSEPSPASVRVSGHEGLAAIAFEAARPRLVEKAQEYGIAACVLSNVRHFSALWYETETLAVDHGLASFAFVGSKAFVAHQGGRKRTYGTNPMSFAFPRGGGKPPMVWDQASSVMARGEIQLAMRDGHDLPPGAAVDPDGNDTVVPEIALKGAQKTFAGHKGTSIALTVELLAAVLTGSALGIELDDAPETHPTANGEFIIAMDPEKLSGLDSSQIYDRAEMLFSHILEDEGTRLPGDRRAAAREITAQHGVQVPAALYDECTALLASS